MSSILPLSEMLETRTLLSSAFITNTVLTIIVTFYLLQQSGGNPSNHDDEVDRVELRATVVGRLGISAGQVQAIPFATLSAHLGPVNSSIFVADAKCDGMADDTVAAQAALTDAAGRPVIFPAGICVITSTLMELLVYPAIFYIWRARKLAR